jgi:hypothetical protein
VKFFLSGRGLFFGMLLEETQPFERASSTHQEASLTNRNDWTGISGMKPMRWTHHMLFVSLASFATLLISAIAGSEPSTLDQVSHESHAMNDGRLTDDLMQQQLRQSGNGHGPIRSGILFPFELPGDYGDLLKQITTRNLVVSSGSSVQSTSPVPRPGTVIALGTILVGFSCIGWGRNHKR